jgi:hypothetical protein
MKIRGKYYRSGTRLKITLTGDVVCDGDFKDTVYDQDFQGIIYGKLRNTKVDVEIIESEYDPGTVVIDANGVFWCRSLSGWTAFGTSGIYGEGALKHPLKVIRGGTLEEKKLSTKGKNK